MLSNLWKEGALINTVTNHARGTIVVTIDLDQREKLFEQLEVFAATHAFHIDINTTTPAGDVYDISISGENVDLLGDNFLYPNRYEFVIYDNDPADPVTEEFINNLLNDLKKFLGEVPNVRIFE
jgi:hypothetical protein